MVDVDGTQTWHALPVCTAPPAKKAPSSQQPDAQLPALQTSARPQPASGAGPLNGVQAELLEAGWQLSQALPATKAPLATKPPSIQQPGAQLPSLQTSSEPQPPLGARPLIGVQLSWLTDGWQLWQGLEGLVVPAG
jgi:hypothetical protein